MTTDGAMLGSCGDIGRDERVVGAIVANIWQEYERSCCAICPEASMEAQIFGFAVGGGAQDDARSPMRRSRTAVMECVLRMASSPWPKCWTGSWCACTGTARRTRACCGQRCARGAGSRTHLQC